jgi:hypothetical protein
VGLGRTLVRGWVGPQPGTVRSSLDARCRMAADCLASRGGPSGEERHEGLLVWDLAMEMCGVVRWKSSAGQLPGGVDDRRHCDAGQAVADHPGGQFHV